MKLNKQLLHRFLQQECTPEEQEFVIACFKHHPEELDNYLDEEDWKNFTSAGTLHPALSQQMFDAIAQQINGSKKPGRLAKISNLARRNLPGLFRHFGKYHLRKK